MKANLVRTFVLLLLIAATPNCRQSADRSTSSGKPWRPKKGTSYTDGLPREIVWRKDGAEMVLVPGGEFLFGKTKDTLTLPSFYMDRFPVTNERYGKFVKATGHRVPFLNEKWAEKLNWRRKKYPSGKASHPVVLVSRDDAMAYCKWAGKALPTEEQWEKAARGTGGQTYPWGDEFDEKKCNTVFSGIGTTTPVDKYPRGVSPYGCYDMAGNVWEWTMSRMGAVVRGGSFFDGDAETRCSLRVVSPADIKCRNIGFRSCWTPRK